MTLFRFPVAAWLEPDTAPAPLIRLNEYQRISLCRGSDPFFGYLGRGLLRMQAAFSDGKVNACTSLSEHTLIRHFSRMAATIRPFLTFTRRVPRNAGLPMRSYAPVNQPSRALSMRARRSRLRQIFPCCRLPPDPECAQTCPAGPAPPISRCLAPRDTVPDGPFAALPNQAA